MDTEFREGANHILKVLISLNDKEKLASDGHQLDKYLRDHAEEIFTFIQNDFGKRIIYQEFSTYPSLTYRRTTYYIGIHLYGRDEVKKFIDAGEYTKYSSRSEYLEELREPQQQIPLITDKSVHIHGNVSDSIVAYSSHLEDVALKTIQQTKYKKTGTNTTTSIPKNWVQRNSGWIYGVLIPIIILALSIIAHKKGYL